MPTSPSCSCQGLHSTGPMKPRQVCPWTWGLFPAQGMHLLLSHLLVQPEVKLRTYHDMLHGHNMITWTQAQICSEEAHTEYRNGWSHRQCVTQWLATGKTMPSISPKESNHIKHKYRQVSPLLLLDWKRQDVTSTHKISSKFTGTYTFACPSSVVTSSLFMHWLCLYPGPILWAPCPLAGSGQCSLGNTWHSLLCSTDTPTLTSPSG